MKKRNATLIRIESLWKNENNFECWIISERQIVQVPGAEIRVPVPAGTFCFRGYNPFPCYSMLSTYHVVSEWMTKNKWKPTGEYKQTTYYDVVDDETGEILEREKETIIRLKGDKK